MLQLPGKHIGFAFSDSAGANACVALAQICQCENNMQCSLFSNKEYRDINLGGFHLTDEVPAFKQLGVDCLFTGTSHPASSQYFEVRCIHEAKKQGVYTISLIDHWVNFRLRFTGPDNQQYYPDEIWVVDERARHLAIEEGLPAGAIRIRENPHHTFLKQLWKPLFQGKDYLKELGISHNGYHILFAPDPLSLRNGKEVHGFTEAEALEDLIKVVSELNGDIVIVIKCHPLQPKPILEKKVIEANGTSIYLLTNADALELVMACDLTIGFYSNLLLEAAILGKKVLRYFPGFPETDFLRHNGTLRKVNSLEQLKEEINKAVYG